MATLLLEARRCDAAQAALEELTAPSSGQQQQHPAASRMSADERAGVAAQLAEVRAAARWQRTPDHYRLLGLPRGCGDEDVRRSYRKAALKYHPDKALAACKYAAEFPAAVVGSSGAGAGSSAGGSSGGGAAAVGSRVGGALVLRMVGGVELETRLREEATALFNLINQANEELADRHRRAKVGSDASRLMVCAGQAHHEWTCVLLNQLLPALLSLSMLSRPLLLIGPFYCFLTACSPTPPALPGGSAA